MKVYSATGQQQRIKNKTPKNEEREVYVGSLCPRRIYMWFNITKVEYNVYTRFHRRKSVYMLENQFFFFQGILVQVIGLRPLIQGIDPRYWVQGIGPKWFWSKVLRKA